MANVLRNALSKVMQFSVLDLSMGLFLSALSIFALSSAALDHYWLALRYVQDLDMDKIDALAFAKSWESKSFMLLLFKFARYALSNLITEIFITCALTVLLGNRLLKSNQRSAWIKIGLISNYHYLLVYLLMFGIVLINNGQASEIQLFPLSLHAWFFPQILLEHPLYLWTVTTSLTSVLTLPLLAAGYAQLKGHWDWHAPLFAILVLAGCHFLRFQFLFPFFNQ